MPPTRVVKSVGRANLLKNIQATLESSQAVIDDAPANSSNQSAGVSQVSAGPSGRVTTIAELLRSQNQEPEFSSDDSEEDDFFVPSETQMKLGATQTPTNQDAMDSTWSRPVLCIGPAEGPTTDIPDSQTTNPPIATLASTIAEFDETEEIIEDAMEVCDSSDNSSDSGSDDGETKNPEFLFLDSPNAENIAAKELESIEIPENMFTGLSPEDISENEELSLEDEIKSVLEAAKDLPDLPPDTTPSPEKPKNTDKPTSTGETVEPDPVTQVTRHKVPATRHHRRSTRSLKRINYNETTESDGEECNRLKRVREDIIYDENDIKDAKLKTKVGVVL